jgi:hypothetical protein
MRVALRKSVNPAVQRREQMLSARTRSAPLRRAFPDLGQLRIELTFSDLGAHTPSPQLHTLFPAAPAFFRFVCPCADCDADFDLTSAVTNLLADVPGRKRTAASVNGQLSCHGVRLRDRAGSKACTMRLDFKLISAPRHTD